MGRRPSKSTGTTPETSWLTPPQVAAELMVSPIKIIGWIESGELRAFNACSGHTRARWRVSRADLNAFVDGRSNADHRKEAAPRTKRRKAVKEWV